MNIYTWLEKFEKLWKNKEIDKVLNLFTEDIEYWENPYKKLSSKKAIKIEWKEVLRQENLVIFTNVFNSENNKHTVTWKIEYNKNGEQQIWSGVYLIELNDRGLCTYFLQIGEKK